MASLIFTKIPAVLTSQNDNTSRIVGSGRTNRRCGCHPFTTSGNDGSGKSGGDGGTRFKEEDDDDDDEGWVPPTGNSIDESLTSSSTTPLPKSERIETSLEASRQVKEQDRLDSALEEMEQEAEALFQLSEEEQATLTDEEILERLDEILKKEEEIFQKELEREAASKQMQQQQPPIATDWLQNRRAMLGQDDEETSSSKKSVVVPILLHTPLTADEIELLLEAHGGEDIVVIEDDPEAPRMGGADGMIFCTGGGGSGSKSKNTASSINSSPYLISTLSRVLIDHMKARKLHEIGVAPSAKQNTTNRASTSMPGASSVYGGGSSTSNPFESWRIVNCGKYIVHILDEPTRLDLNLEDLWSGADPLWKLNVFDDDEIEEYCLKHPVPESFNGTGSRRDSSGFEDDDNEGVFMDGAAMKKLERTRFGSTRRHKPVISQATKNKDRRVGRKKRREQRERDYFGSSEENY